MNGHLSDGIDFTPMDLYMQTILSVLSREGSLIARVFPPQSDVLLYFLERIANDVVSEYITQLLSAAQPLAHPLFLLATAATFGQVYRLVECVMEIEPRPEAVTKERVEDVVFKMFEPLMDDYLTEEVEWIREVLEGMCQEWDEKVRCLPFPSPPFSRSRSTPPLPDRLRPRHLGPNLPRLFQPRPSQEKRPGRVHQSPPPPRHHHPQDR